MQIAQPTNKATNTVQVEGSGFTVPTSTEQSRTKTGSKGGEMEQEDMIIVKADGITYYYESKVNAAFALDRETEFSMLLYSVAAIKDDGTILKSRAAHLASDAAKCDRACVVAGRCSGACE